MSDPVPSEPLVRIFFSDFFGVSVDSLLKHGAFDVSLITDLPLFIDPFLLFNSKKEEYQKLHADIVQYIQFLSQEASDIPDHAGALKAWFTFPEVKQTWLGFAKIGNRGQGLGLEFARGLKRNLGIILDDFGDEQLTSGSHVEKVCLIDDGIGRDNISDFVTNLIKGYLLQFTEAFAKEHLGAAQRRRTLVPKVEFAYETKCWMSREFDLPYANGDYVILTPRDMLTKDQPWINRHELEGNFENILESVPNDQLRWQLGEYFRSRLPPPRKDRQPSREEIRSAVSDTLRTYPVVIDHYIKGKEDDAERAAQISEDRVLEVERAYCDKAKELVRDLSLHTDFYTTVGDTCAEARDRIGFLKTIIEDQDGYRIFYDSSGYPFRRETDVHILFRLTWYATHSDVNREVNNGRGPVDFKISRGAKDKALIEFKLASNNKLEQNLKKQVAIYQRANDAVCALKVILFFSKTELARVVRILNKLGLQHDRSIYLIDARRDNKPSGSRAA